MKLKGIKPGMAIHCTEIEHVKSLVENGIIGSSMLKLSLPIWITIRENDRGWVPEYSNVIKNTGKSYCKNAGLECIEFYDLIEPELELTAEEVLRIFAEISDRCDKGLACAKCPLSCQNAGTKMDLCAFSAFEGNEQKIVEACQQWKADHKKEEPEVEWHYYAEIHGEGFDSVKNCNTEEEAVRFIQEELKKCKKDAYGEYKRVCRVKAVN